MEPISRRQFLLRGLAGAIALAFPEVVLAGENEKAEPAAIYPTRKYSPAQCVNAIIQIESRGNPRAVRYEKHLGMHSYGLGQILESTAREIEQTHPELPRLGKTKQDLERALFDPGINRQYTTAYFLDQQELYEDPFLAVAAYNAGHFSPRNARCMQQLGDLYKQDVSPNGNFGRNKKATVLLKRLQGENGLHRDGIMNSVAYKTLQSHWTKHFPSRANPFAIIPQNGLTPNHVQKFARALKATV